MTILVRCAATGISALVLLAGCAGAPASAPSGATAPSSGETSTSATAGTSVPPSATSGGQVFAVQSVGISLSLPSDFVILDKSKAAADPYWQDVADRTGTEAEDLKAIVDSFDGVAVGPDGTQISLAKRDRFKSMPSVEAVEDDLAGMPNSGVREIETPLGAGIRVSLQLGTSRFQEFVYLPGAAGVVSLSIGSRTESGAVELFEQVLPTVSAM